VRRKERASYERRTIHAILDEALYCHVGFVLAGQPYVIPTVHARVGEHLYLHGAVASRTLRTAALAAPLCVTVTLLDGLVLARSAFNHSMNYRSVVILATASELSDATEKRAALEALVERVVPGRAAEVRAPSSRELNATAILCVPIEEASAKIRTGPPQDDALGCWAGVVPLQLTPGTPQPDPRLRARAPPPVLGARGSGEPSRS
jgi:nitroimidazol reductase NimA-like FMN-containing flavoprotein (pyridoxamine 5'-phosphate oxidase superfamily)